jgi:hypothetical protein
LVGLIVLPANLVAYLEVSGLFAGHLRRIANTGSSYNLGNGDTTAFSKIAQIVCAGKTANPFHTET